MKNNDEILFQTREEYLSGKTELTDEDVANIIELKHDYPNINNLKRYTDKSFRDLSEVEKYLLVRSLLEDEEYLKYKNCYIAKSKLLYDASETLIKETDALRNLNELGYEVYLLPYAYARDGMNCYQKSADSITAGEFLEMKSVISTGKRAGQSSFEAARHQANNIYLSIVNDVSEEMIINNIYRSIGQIKNENMKNGFENNFEGKLILHFEKTNQTSLFQLSKDGNVRKIENSDYEHFKKIKGTEKNSSQVVRDPMQNHGSPCTYNISDNASKVKSSKRKTDELFYQRER